MVSLKCIFNLDIMRSDVSDNRSGLNRDLHFGKSWFAFLSGDNLLADNKEDFCCRDKNVKKRKIFDKSKKMLVTLLCTSTT